MFSLATYKIETKREILPEYQLKIKNMCFNMRIHSFT